MTRHVIVVGDTLGPYGGQVISGSPVDTVHGRAMARVGDPVLCNEHGPNAIAEGVATFLCADRPVALEGHHAQCGCMLVSLQPPWPFRNQAMTGRWPKRRPPGHGDTHQVLTP